MVSTPQTDHNAGTFRDDDLLALTGQARYAWNIRSDRLEWSANAQGLIGLRDFGPAQQGRQFESLISAEGSQSRFGVVFSAAEEKPVAGPVPYQCIYAIAAQNVASGQMVWIEDTGAWYPDASGRPERAEGIVRIVNDRRMREETLRRKSDFDDLTGLPNRSYLEMQLAETISECMSDQTSAVLLVVSMERMPLFNEIYGFDIGDEVLKTAGAIIAGRMRGNDVVARFSGAKFGVILKNCSGGEIYVAARRFLDSLRKEIIETSAGPVSLDATIGACFLPKHASTPTAAIAAASAACDLARFDGGYRIRVYDHDPELAAKRRADAEMAARVIATCESGSMRLAFQPVVEAVSGRVAFHECLIRIADDSGLPGDAGNFVPLAEKLGLIGIVDHRTLELTLETLQQNSTAQLSLNVSNETAEDPLWLSKLADGLNRIPGAASRLIVEITESHAARDLEEASKFVSTIQSMGCKVAIDDFGAGFTSFANLKSLPVDIIKIDGSFASDLPSNRQNQVFIQSLIMLARAFEVKTVVEWVEDHETAAMLAAWGVDYLQGHNFGHATIANQWSDARPVTKDQAERLAG
ncbi:MAG: GGDEF and EAL domain-containing protein [Nitratireductor sp.]